VRRLTCANITSRAILTPLSAEFCCQRMGLSQYHVSRDTRPLSVTSRPPAAPPRRSPRSTEQGRLPSPPPPRGPLLPPRFPPRPSRSPRAGPHPADGSPRSSRAAAEDACPGRAPVRAHATRRTRGGVAPVGTPVPHTSSAQGPSADADETTAHRPRSAAAALVCRPSTMPSRTPTCATIRQGASQTRSWVSSRSRAGVLRVNFWRADPGQFSRAVKARGDPGLRSVDSERTGRVIEPRNHRRRGSRRCSVSGRQHRRSREGRIRRSLRGRRAGHERRGSPRNLGGLDASTKGQPAKGRPG